MAEKALSAEALWERGLAEDDNVSVVAGYLENIVKNGERAALRSFLSEVEQ